MASSSDPEPGSTPVPPRAIRTLVQQTLVRLGCPDAGAPRETILIRDGCYCGHRYRSGEVMAEWETGADQIRFYHQAGLELAVEPVVATSRSPLRRAA